MDFYCFRKIVELTESIGEKSEIKLKVGTFFLWNINATKSFYATDHNPSFADCYQSVALKDLVALTFQKKKFQLSTLSHFFPRWIPLILLFFRSNWNPLPLLGLCLSITAFILCRVARAICQNHRFESGKRGHFWNFLKNCWSFRIQLIRHHVWNIEITTHLSCPATWTLGFVGTGQEQETTGPITWSKLSD